MSIRVIEMPAGADPLIRHAVAALAHHPRGENAHALVSPGEAPQELTLEIAVPHRIYQGQLGALLRGELLSAARAGGWRCLVLRGEEAVGSATVEQSGSAGEVAFSHLTRGPFVQATVEAIHQAEALPESSSDDLELRMLDVSELTLRTIWLHGSHRDILIPLSPAPPELAAYRPYSQSELTAALQQTAWRKLSAPAVGP